MNTVSKNIAFMFLILALAGAVFACSYMGVMSMEHGNDATMSHNNSVLAHVVYAQQLTSTPANAFFLALVMLFLFTVFALHNLLKKLHLFEKPNPFLPLWRRNFLVSPVVKQHINHWLSRFERSPELMIPA